MWLCQVPILYESFQNFEIRHLKPLQLKSTYLDVFLHEWNYSVFLTTMSLCFSPRCRPFLWQFGGHDWLSSLANNEVLLALCHPHCLYGEWWSERRLLMPNYCLWYVEGVMYFTYVSSIRKLTGHVIQYYSPESESATFQTCKPKTCLSVYCLLLFISRVPSFLTWWSTILSSLTKPTSTQLGLMLLAGASDCSVFFWSRCGWSIKPLRWKGRCYRLVRRCACGREMTHLIMV